MNLEGIQIDIFRAEDADGVAALFRAVYGDGYPVKLVYDPAALVAAFEAHENIPVVARTREGRVVGYEALYHSAPGKGLYELGQGLVLPEYRKMGIMEELHQCAVSTVAPRFDMDAVFGESVCNHLYMQKAWGSYKTVETALEVDLMPAEAYTKEKSASGRVAALPMFRTFRARPHRVYLPAVYSEALNFLYSGLDDSRDLARGKSDLPQDLNTLFTSQVFDFARVARVAVHEAGADFPASFANLEETLLAKGLVVIQVWLKLTWPFIDHVVYALRERGYFLGGLLPQWFGDDGMLLQKVAGRPNWEDIQLYSDRAKKIEGFVRSDWEGQARMG